MKLKNSKNNKEFLVIGFLTLTKDKDIKYLDIRELKDYVLEDGKDNY